jgi:hypothetical protein
MSPSTRGYALSQQEGEPIWFLGALATIKATSEQTHNAFALQAKALTLPPAEPPDLTKLQTLAAKYGIEFVGPAQEEELMLLRKK